MARHGKKKGRPTQPRRVEVVMDLGDPPQHVDRIGIENGRIKLMHEGNEVFPKSARYEIGYQSAVDPERTIPTWAFEVEPRASGLPWHPTVVARGEFDALFTVDTAWKDGVGVACSNVATFRPLVHDLVAVAGVFFEIFEFRGARVEDAEKIGWAITCEQIQKWEGYDPGKTIWLQTDHDKSNHSTFNGGAPYLRGRKLPPGIRLVYAKDQGGSVAYNKLIETCHRYANEVRDQILAGHTPDDGLLFASGAPFTRYRFWRVTPHPGVIRDRSF